MTVVSVCHSGSALGLFTLFWIIQTHIDDIIMKVYHISYVTYFHLSSQPY